MAWHGMSSTGHFLTIISFLFFFMVLGDSFLTKHSPLMPVNNSSRLNKRAI